MRPFIVVGLLLLAAGLNCVTGRVLPLTAREICLMLRSGYSNEAVQQELSVRRFAGSYDATDEKALKDAGAAPVLIDAIKSGSYQSSTVDARAAQEQLAAQAQRQALEAERSRRRDAAYQDQVARARAAAPAKGEAPHVVADSLKGDLVFWKNGSLARFGDEALEKKKLIALYFSAHWCAPCRKFTPQLVDFYNRVTPQHPEFEVIFVSNDRSPFGFETYMREMQMPWPAIDFEKLPGKAALKKYSGEEIPCLVVVDASGRVILDTYAGKTYVGPEKVLANLDAMFANASATTVAAGR